MNITPEINIEFSSVINSAIHFVKDKSGLISPDDYSSIANFKEIGIVYFIYLINNKENLVSLVYIGKSKGHLFKARLRHHFHKKHPKTGSKLLLVQNELDKGNILKLKFLKVTPESFRNTLEEELINYFCPIWNIQKENALRRGLF